ncbi:MAG: hypothetical protein ACYST6_10585 [Planctomycetota bacterium]|jgi:hypothetical protein
MQNPCFNTAIIITAGAVVAFFSVLGYFTRAAYYNGFAAGFDAARERFKRIIHAAGVRDVFERFEDDIDADGTP